MGITGVNGETFHPYYTQQKNTRGTGNANFNNSVYHAIGKNTDFTLHLGTSKDGKLLGSVANGGKSGIAVFKPDDFDSANPVYKVKIWDEEGNMTERMVDVSKVDARNSDSVDMYAYSCYLSDSRQYPEAQNTYSRLQNYAWNSSKDDLFCNVALNKSNWVGIANSLMKMQYGAGNLQGYLDYKKFADFFG